MYRVKFSRIWNVAKEVVSFLTVRATSHCYTNLIQRIGQLAGEEIKRDEEKF